MSKRFRVVHWKKEQSIFVKFANNKLVEREGA